MKMTTFNELKIGDLFYKYETTKSTPLVKIEPIYPEGCQALNCHDDNTGELFTIDPGRLVYTEDQNAQE